MLHRALGKNGIGAHVASVKGCLQKRLELDLRTLNTRRRLEFNLWVVQMHGLQLDL